MSIRILLDTTVVRKFVHDDPDCLDIRKARSSRFPVHFSLPYTCWLELLDDLLSLGRKFFSAWAAKARDLDTILDPELPLLPDGIHLGALLGWEGIAPMTEDVRLIYRKWWELMRSAQRAMDLYTGISFFDSRGEQVLALKKAEIQIQIEEERQFWQNLFPKFKQIADAHNGSVKQVVTALLSGGLKPPGLAAAFAHFLKLYGEGYNPSSDKNQGDVLDFYLTAALDLPSIVVTADGKFLKRMHASGEPILRRIIATEDLHRRLNSQGFQDLL